MDASAPPTQDATSMEPLAALRPDEFTPYISAVEFLVRQNEWIRRTQVALQEAQMVARAVDAERIRMWRNVCANYGFDPDADYRIDGEGNVFLDNS